MREAYIDAYLIKFLLVVDVEVVVVELVVVEPVVITEVWVVVFVPGDVNRASMVVAHQRVINVET